MKVKRVERVAIAVADLDAARAFFAAVLGAEFRPVEDVADQGFRYQLMPPFCVGTAATAVGDYGTSSGDLDVPQALADDLIVHLLAADLDVAMSEKMVVDHGISQPLDILFGSCAARPVISSRTSRTPLREETMSPFSRAPSSTSATSAFAASDRMTSRDHGEPISSSGLLM